MSKLLSRKLLVFLVATVALFMGVLDTGSFVAIAAVYMGTQGVVDALAAKDAD